MLKTLWTNSSLSQKFAMVAIPAASVFAWMALKNSKPALPSPEEIAGKYIIGNKKFTVSVDVATAFLNAEAKTGFPHTAMIPIVGRESEANPKARNPDSKACGLFQFLPSTLYEVLYMYGADHGYDEYAELVKRYTYKDKRGKKRVGYKPVNESARKKIMNLCGDETFNTLMYTAYTMPNIREYEAWLGNRKITAGEIVALNNLGLGGLKRFAEQAWSGKDMPASRFFGRAISRQNPDLVRYPDGKRKTMRQSWNDLVSYGGWEETHIPHFTPEPE